ncbi:MAG: ATP-binding cassette domain-containing protein [Butyrivibrio sp.]|nr:ATP-binding cassette domain-containing protein [Butyrivibrio sp.]
MTIVLEGITQEYDGKVVIENFNLNIEDKRIYALVGPEGCGKSTILKVFMGTLKPTKGEVHRMGDYKYPTLHTGYLSQEGQLNPKKNAIWNVKKAYWRISKGMIIEELLKFIPEEKIKLPVSELSDSEKRLVEIVRAFMVPADFMVLDEPFMFLDDEQRGKVREYIDNNIGSRPLIMASRDETYFDFARIIHLG